MKNIRPLFLTAITAGFFLWLPGCNPSDNNSDAAKKAADSGGGVDGGVAQDVPAVDTAPFDSNSAGDSHINDSHVDDSHVDDIRVADSHINDSQVDDGHVDDGPSQVDAAGPAQGFGTLSGTCGVLDDELTSTSSVFFHNQIDFGTDPYDEADLALLTEGGQEIIRDGNAGGSSLYSEVFAYEVLSRCEAATLLKTETEIVYQGSMGAMTDLLVEIDGIKIGVSVTRAVAWPFDDPYTQQQASDLLQQKLQGVLESSARVATEDAWQKQILHVIAYAPGHATALEAAYADLASTVTADTIVYVTVSNGDDAFLY